MDPDTGHCCLICSVEKRHRPLSYLCWHRSSMKSPTFRFCHECRQVQYCICHLWCSTVLWPFRLMQSLNGGIMPHQYLHAFWLVLPYLLSHHSLDALNGFICEFSLGKYCYHSVIEVPNTYML